MPTSVIDDGLLSIDNPQTTPSMIQLRQLGLSRTFKISNSNVVMNNVESVISHTQVTDQRAKYGISAKLQPAMNPTRRLKILLAARKRGTQVKAENRPFIAIIETMAVLP